MNTPMDEWGALAEYLRSARVRDAAEEAMTPAMPHESRPSSEVAGDTPSRPRRSRGPDRAGP